jgi:hypothetical protein
MSLEHSPSRTGRITATPQDPTDEPDYWFSLINEGPAAEFVNLKVRTLQGYRYKGGGPNFVRLSARCVKYRRIDLLRWAEAHLRASTSDTVLEAT